MLCENSKNNKILLHKERSSVRLNIVFGYFAFVCDASKKKRKTRQNENAVRRVYFFKILHYYFAEKNGFSSSYYSDRALTAADNNTVKTVLTLRNRQNVRTFFYHYCCINYNYALYAHYRRK